MAEQHSTETNSQDFQIIVMERVHSSHDLELCQPCLVTVQVRRDGKGSRILSKPLHTVPAPKGGVQS
jgi:hypothetical protein